MKTEILEAIGETELKHSAEVNEALAANERLKYYFSLLQMAAEQADHPGQPAATLRQERQACHITDSTLDDFVVGAQLDGDCYKIPGWAKVRGEITRDMRLMAAPAGEAFTARLDHLLGALPRSPGDLIDANAVHDITRTGRGKSDSLHQLVMDLHKALNAAQADMAEERLEGAAVYHIADSDRALIAAFMAGVNRTALLKFTHAGLGTTATRSGPALVIQNDIGETDAHVVVVHVEQLAARVIYTDVHLDRLQFFKSLLAQHKVTWEEELQKQAPALNGGGVFYQTTGYFQAKDAAELRAYLEFLGSRLVFLIDWNRARKQLRGFLRGAQRVELLQWAAEAEVGHRGFLELGGARLINNAIEATAGSAMHFGDNLCDVLGDEGALSFLRFVFRTASEGLLNHVSPRLIQDRVRTELQAHFSSEGKRLLQLGSEHASMIFEIASLVREGIHTMNAQAQPLERDGARYQKLARRARKFEHEADQLVITAREAARRRTEYTSLFRLIEAADDAADQLEEVAFLLELLVDTEANGNMRNVLGPLADLLLAGAQEWIKALSHAAQISHSEGSGASDDAGDFLTAIDRLFELEHEADDAYRSCIHAAIERARNFRELHLYTEMARCLEAAADAFKWAGVIARDYLLGNVLGA